MKLLIVPKPMFNKEMAVKSYCFRFQTHQSVHRSHFEAVTESPCLDVLQKAGVEAFTAGLPIFVPVNQFALIIDLDSQYNLPKELVIFLLNESIPPSELILERIKILKEQGFRFALEKINNYNAMHPIIELSDFIFINCQTPRFKDIFHVLQNKYRHLAFLASGVDDMDLFEEIKDENFDSFEGKFYSLPITKGVTKIAPVKVNYITLINLIRNEDFDLNKAAKIIGQDTSLSISLLKLINSPYMGLTAEIKTIKHAVAMLGQREVRKWVTTAVTGLLCEDKPSEVSKLSLMRAKFAENLAGSFEMAMQAQTLFMTGLFSVLDIILGMPMTEALKVIAVSDEVRQALIDKTGDFAKVMDLITTYETADWTEVSRLIILNNLREEDVFNAYLEATLWYSSIINSTVTLD